MPKQDIASRQFQRKIIEFCDVRIAPATSKRVLENIRPYLVSLIIYRKSPPLLNGRINWTAIADACGIEEHLTMELKKQLHGQVLDAIIRWLGAPAALEDSRPSKPKSRAATPGMRAPTSTTSSTRKPQRMGSDGAAFQSASAQRGPEPKPIQEFPEPLFEAADDPETFRDALVYHMRRFGDSYWQLWHGACDAFHRHAANRSKEVQRVMRVHRDPFEPIMVILEADSPLAEYRKITDEILKRMPDQDRYPRPAAEAVRSFLMLRLGLHLGLRQKNLRQLRLCPRGHFPTSERRLEDMKCGELRWSDHEHGWEVLIPSVAFKNSGSSFFGQKPFRLILPDLLDLYKYLEAYIDRHRGMLLGSAQDPGTFFVKTVKTTSYDAAYDSTKFYEAWRTIIQRYGIYNSYTGRGAIKGLLPHGPHNLRDILATHILKQTGSYEQASYAIQDTPDVVQQHYGRFLPQDKAALAAKILNQVWEAA